MLSVARVVLVAARGGISQQLGLVNDDMDAPPRFVATEKARSETALELPFMELPYFNGLGGFTDGGEEYAIYLGPNDTTPAPWINVFAHEDFGSIISESGQGFAWFGNSQANRVTPWNNDAVSDTADGAVYIRDEETGEFWTTTALPIRESEAYRARHGQGYSVFEHSSHGIEQTLTVFVPMDDAKRPVRLQTLKLTNRSGRARKLTATSYDQFILGTVAEETRPFVVTSWDTQSETLLARNSYNSPFPRSDGVRQRDAQTDLVHGGSHDVFGAQRLADQPVRAAAQNAARTRRRRPRLVRRAASAGRIGAGRKRRNHVHAGRSRQHRTSPRHCRGFPQER